MTQNQKELLLKDLCSRLPYGVKASTKVGGNIKISFIGEDTIIGEDGDSYDISFITPYLIPLSSMTIEKKGECPCGWSMIDAWIDGSIYLFEDEELNINEIINLLDWLNKNHFDYRGLIEKGLAIDATNLNIY
jgi:hypothetical protein